MDEPVKACNTCNEEKPLSAFPKSKGEGRRNKCYCCTNHKTEKKCNTCNVVKPNSAFSPRFRNGREGLRGICDDCIAVATKVCPGCGKEKPRTEFYVRSIATQKLHSKCKACNDDASRRFAAENPKKVQKYDRVKSLRGRYGMEVEDYDALSAKQNESCALCDVRQTDETGRRLHVDHDHDTGRTRGLLCKRCNWALGHFGDGPKGIQKVIAYLDPARFPMVANSSLLSLYSSGSAEYHRNKQYLALYGIGIPEFDAMLHAQKSVCAICETNNPKGRGRFCVDHDHATKRIRGLLCYPCNSALGTLGETLERLEKVLAYVQPTDL